MRRTKYYLMEFNTVTQIYTINTRFQATDIYGTVKKIMVMDT